MRPKPAPWLEFGAGQSQAAPQPNSNGGYSFIDALKKRLHPIKQGGMGTDMAKAASSTTPSGGAPQSL